MQLTTNAQPVLPDPALPTAEELLTALPWGVVVLDEQRRIRRVNQQAAYWCGASPADLLGHPLAAANLPAALRTALLQLLEPGAAALYEVWLPPHARWITLSATRQPDGWVLYGQDITPQKQREQQYQTLAANTPDVLTRWSPDLRLRYANAAFATKAGQPLAALLGRTFDEMGLPAEVTGPYQEVLQRVFDTGRPQEYYNVFPGPQGPIQYYSRIVPELRDGRVETVLGIARDITELRQREAETLHLRDALTQQATDKYQTLVYALEEGFCVIELVLDASGQQVTDYYYRELNPVFERQSGLTPGVLGKSVRELLPDLEPFWFDTYGRVARTGEPVRLEHYVPQVGRWFDVHASRVGGPGSRQVAVLFTDITARKHDQVRQAFRLALSEALAPTMRPEEVQETVTRTAMRYFGADRCYYCEIEDGEALIRRDAAREGLPSVAGTYALASFPILQAVIDAGRPFAVEDVRTTDTVDEEMRQMCLALHVISYLNVPVVRAGQVVGVLCLVQGAPRTWTAAETELTVETAERTWAAVERARAEAALAASAAKLRAFVSITADTVYEMSADWGEMYALTDNAFLAPTNAARPGWMADYIPADEQPRVWQAIRQAVASRSPFELEHRVIRHDGSTGWTLSRAVPLLDAAGHLARWFGTARDITRRKQAEARQSFLLQLSEALRPLSDPAAVQQAAMQVLGEHLGVSRAFYGEVLADEDTIVFGLGYAQGLAPLVGQATFSGFDVDMMNDYRAGRTVVLPDILAETSYSATTQAEFAAVGVQAAVGVPLVKSGKVRAILSLHQATPRRWTDAEIALLEEVAELTWAAVERAHAETALRRSEERRRVALEGGGLGAWRWDVASGLIWADAALLALWGFPLTDEPLRLNEFTDRIAPKGRAELEAIVAKALEAGQSFEGDLEIIGGPAKGRWVRWRGRTDPDQPTLLNGVSFDVTAPRAAELALQQSEERQTFLLKLVDALRPLTAAVAIQGEAARVLGEHLQASRTYYGAIDYAREAFVVEQDYIRGDAPSVVGVHPFAVFGPVIGAMQAHQAIIIEDTQTDPRVAEADRSAYVALSLWSFVVVPLVKGGVAVSAMAVVDVVPRQWTPVEAALVQEVAERTWEAVARAQAEAVVRESEERYRSLVEASEAIVWILDGEGRAVSEMPRWGAFTGLTFDQYKDFGYANATHPDDQAAVQAKWMAAVAKGKPLEHEFRLRHHGGGYRRVSVRAVPVQGPGGEVQQWVGTVADIHEKYEAEEALRLSEQRLRTLIANLPGAAAFVVGFDLRYQLAGGEALDAAGFVPADLLGRTVAEAMPPGVVAQYEAHYRQALAGHGFSLEHEAHGRAYVSRGVPLPGPTGQPEAVLVVSYDISERKRAEEALAASEAKYRTLFESMEQGFGIAEVLPADGPAGLATDFRWLEVNPQFERFIGLARADLLSGQTAHQLLPNLEPFWFEHYGQVAATGQPVRFEQYEPAIGRWLDVYAFAVGEPAARRVAMLFTDITERKQAEEALRHTEERHRQQLEQQVARRTQQLRQSKELQEAVFTTVRHAITVFTALRDENGRIIDFRYLLSNGVAERHMGVSIVGKTLRTALGGYVDEDNFRRMVEVVESGQPQEATLHFTAAGGPIYLFTQYNKLHDGVVLMHEDITQRLAAERDLRASHDLLQSVFDTNLIAMSVQEAVRDETGSIQDFRLRLVNRELERTTGRTDLEGTLYAQEYPGVRKVSLFDLAVRAIETGEPQGMEYFYAYEGFNRWFACQFVKLGDGVVATNLDITERKQAEAERFKNLQLLEQAEAVVGLGSWEYDLATRQFTWSAGMYHLFGLPVGQPVWPGVIFDVIWDEDRPQAEYIRHCLTTGACDIKETVRLHVDGQVRTVRIRAVVVRDAQGQPLRVLGVNLDISELQRLEADNLHLRLTQQRALFEAVQAAQEAERKRMAESLHNGIGQILYATKLRLDQLPSADPAQAGARREADQLLVEAIRQARALSHELVPLVLEEFGLAAALQDISQKMSNPQLRLRSYVMLDEEAGPLSPALQLALYRMAQELALNIGRHARGATEASLELETMPGWVLLRAEDNGVGFAVPAAESAGLGLRSIRDRVALLGGQLEAGTAPAGGAYVRIRLPLPSSL